MVFLFCAPVEAPLPRAGKRCCLPKRRSCRSRHARELPARRGDPLEPCRFLDICASVYRRSAGAATRRGSRKNPLHFREASPSAASDSPTATSRPGQLKRATAHPPRLAQPGPRARSGHAGTTHGNVASSRQLCRAVVSLGGYRSRKGNGPTECANTLPSLARHGDIDSMTDRANSTASLSESWDDFGVFRETFLQVWLDPRDAANLRRFGRWLRAMALSGDPPKDDPGESITRQERCGRRLPISLKCTDS